MDIANGIEPDRLREMCDAERDGRIKIEHKVTEKQKFVDGIVFGSCHACTIRDWCRESGYKYKTCRYIVSQWYEEHHQEAAEKQKEGEG
jgi:hypothetical protein